VEEIEIKSHLLVDGVRIAAEALEGVGERFKEQGHWLFDWDFDFHADNVLPDNLRLPGGTIVQLRSNSNSPFLIRREKGALVLEKNGELLSELNWIPRPKYYTKTTSDGVPMKRVAQIRGEDCLAICYSNYCRYFATGDECHFCNLVSTKKVYDSVLSTKKFDQIGETAAAAFEEGIVNHIIITGGLLNGANEEETLLKIIAKIREHTGLDKIPGCALPTAPTDLKSIDRLYESGIQGVGFDLEIWNRRYFEAICPGKSKAVGYDNWLKALEYAVEVFGRGNVHSGFVTGLEPRESVLEGVDFLASKGVVFSSTVWSPVPGSKLFGHRAPTAEWYLETTRGIVDILEKHDLPPQSTYCLQCADNKLFYDEFERREPR
jgi:biotin synthase-related radical SAM superfamily protein